MGINILRHIAFIALYIPGIFSYGQADTPSGYNNFQEAVWLSSDRHLYLPGESIDFKAVVLEKDTYIKSKLSKNIRVELLDSNGLPVKQLNLQLRGSRVSGSLLIPVEAKGGWYYIRAYTNYMRNFNESGFGLVAIKVFNPREKNPDFTDNNDTKIKVTLFPGADNTGLFAGYEKSSGISTSGKVVDSEGDIAFSFSTDKSGWAFIPCKLSEDRTYTVNLNDREYEEYTGELTVVNEGDNKIGINQTNDFIETRTSNIIASNLFPVKILIHQSYSLFYNITLESMDGFPALIPMDKLPGGVFQISIIGNDNNVISKRLYSAHSSLQSEPEIVLENSTCDIRDSFNASLVVRTKEAELNVFAGMKEPAHPYDRFIPGMPGWHCSGEIPRDPDAFKGWLLANSYSDNIIYQIIDPVKDDRVLNHLTYLPETRSGVLEGKVIDESSGLGIENAGVAVSVLNNNYFDACTTDEMGKFYFPLPGLEGPADYILNFTSFANEGQKIFVSPEFEPGMLDTRDHFKLSRKELDFLEKINENLKISSIYGVLPAYREPEPIESSQRQSFFYPPDHVTVVEDYIKLANIREIIYEVVPNVSVRKAGSRNYIKVITENPFTVDYQTLILLDGIPLADQTELLSLSPERIEKIEVKNRLYIYGRTLFSAIVNFVSPNRDYAGLELPESSILSTLMLPSIQSPTVERTSTDPGSTPILDSKICWITGTYEGTGTVKITTGDATGKYQLIVSGYDDKGNWIYAASDFYVVNKH